MKCHINSRNDFPTQNPLHLPQRKGEKIYRYTYFNLPGSLENVQLPS